MRTGTAGTGQDGHACGPIQHLRCRRQRRVVGSHDGGRWGHRDGHSLRRRLLQEDLTGHHQDRNPFELKRRAHGRLEQPRELGGEAHKLAVHAALSEDLLGMRLLEVLAPDLVARYVGRDGEYRDPRAIGIEEAVDQVQVARTAAARTYGQSARECRVRGCRKGGCLLMAHVFPGDVAVASQRVGEPVQRVARKSIDPLDARGLQGGHHEVCQGCRHQPPFDRCRT